jgi:putative ABC transport system permease protein
MWRNYLTVGLRNLARNRTYAFINIVGLAIGLAACFALFVYVRYESSYDRWLPDSERIFQVQATWHEVGQPVTPNQASPAPVRDTIASVSPQIERVSVAIPGRTVVARDGGPIYLETLTVDPAFLDIFKLPFVRGDARTALPDINSVVLTETEAQRQFGTLEAIGRTVTVGTGADRRDLHVTAILRDLPRNTHFSFGALRRFDPATRGTEPPSWGAMGQYHYVRLRDPAAAAAINAAFPAWEHRIIPPQTIDGQTSSRADIMDLNLVNVADIHLGEAQLGAMTPGNDARTVATFSIVALLILVMACINFVNLSTARAGQRAREVSLRKVLGASRRQLVLQFLGESMVLTTFAMLIALAALELGLPWLSSLLDADLRIDYLGAGGLLPQILLLTLLVGLAGGLYPAFVLSRFRPATVLKANKSSAEGTGSGRMRAGLVVVQFAVSIGLIICTWVVWRQTEYVQTVDMGFEREGLIQVRGGWRFQEQGSYEAAKRVFAGVPGITGVARTNLGVAATNKSIQAVNAPGAPAALNMGVYRVDTDFFRTMGMRLLAGREFSEQMANDRFIRPPEPVPGGTAPAPAPAGPTLMQRGLNVVINRHAARLLGYRDPAQAIGKVIRVSAAGTDDLVPSTVVGVVEDTRIRTARDEIEPLVFTFDPEGTTLIQLRYRSTDPAAVMAGVAGVWRRFQPDAPFEGAFAEDLLARLYQREHARGVAFAAFSGLAVIISCLGLFGLAAFTAQRRTKEIGIRKVLGARVRHIVQLLTWQFSKPVVLANLIAWPVAWWAMRDWLNTYDTRIDLGPTPFVLAGLIALAIAVGTVAGHAIRVARANPIVALRYE